MVATRGMTKLGEADDEVAAEGKAIEPSASILWMVRPLGWEVGPTTSVSKVAGPPHLTVGPPASVPGAI
jgi:hypothetical protein